jgi:cobalt-zinc-cadmium efflux system outer membrane protein
MRCGAARQHRLHAAQDVTSVTEAQVANAERTTVESAAQQFVAALLAKANLEFAIQLLDSYQHTINVSQERYKAGGMSKVDLFKIQLQTLQFQSDVSAARIAKAEALGSLRQAMGFDSVPRDYDVAGDLAYQPLSLRVEDLQARALALRPDLQAARRSVTSATSQIGLAKANAKQDLTWIIVEPLGPGSATRTLTLDQTRFNSALKGGPTVPNCFSIMGECSLGLWVNPLGGAENRRKTTR